MGSPIYPAAAPGKGIIESRGGLLTFLSEPPPRAKTSTTSRKNADFSQMAYEAEACGGSLGGIFTNALFVQHCLIVLGVILYALHDW